MMGIQTFTFNAKAPIRTLLKGEEPWFVAADVCAALEIEKHRDAVARLDEDERGSVIVDTLGGPQESAAISESGLYTLILRSRKPQARAFRRWVTHEVLPALRRGGRYELPTEPPAGAISGASVLQYEGQPIRVFQHQGQPWVSAKDLCLACGYSWHKGGSLVVNVPPDLKGLALMGTLEGCSRQHVLVLSLAGVKVFSSRARYIEVQGLYRWLRSLDLAGLPENRVDPTVPRAPRTLGRPVRVPPLPDPKAPIYLPLAKDRARFGEEALEEHERRADMRDLRFAYEHHMPGLLADLMHLAERQGLDFTAMLARGRQHFIAERAAAVR
jgi:prophage antirepressor-like protein